MSLHSTLVWQLPIIEHEIDRHGRRLLEWQHPLEKPHDVDECVALVVAVPLANADEHMQLRTV